MNLVGIDEVNDTKSSNIDSNELIPFVFASLASPHLGVTHQKFSLVQTFLIKLFGFLNSLKELFLSDKTNHNLNTLIHISEGKYLENLSKFPMRIAFG